MRSRSIINKEYIEQLLHISPHYNSVSDLFYNGYIIGTVKPELEFSIVKLNDFARMLMSINNNKMQFLYEHEYDLHRQLSKYDFSTLNKGLL